jgi:hypothetical protein
MVLILHFAELHPLSAQTISIKAKEQQFGHIGNRHVGK